MRISDLIKKRVVLDSSVLVKPFLGEDDYEKVEQILAMFRNRECAILVTGLLFYEVGNVFLFKLDSHSCKNALEAIKNLGFSVIDLELSEQKLALDFAKRYQKTSFYDWSYHILAQEYDAIFVTADEKYYQEVQEEGNIILLKNLEI